MKLVLLFNAPIIQADAEIISSEILILKISDQVYSLSDIKFQLRNLRALNCLYAEEGIIVNYFGKKFLNKLDNFLENYPEEAKQVKNYHDENQQLLKFVRLLFKGIKYADDQKLVLNEALETAIRESATFNKCDKEILKESGLKANFTSLMRLELYLRSRYTTGKGKKMKTTGKVLKESIDLFIESIDKQLPHEYFQ